ncbi:MAG: ABC transporter ATP-binding protein/permease [Clostridiales Family XIII bacterium]|jgi:ATP-binding cassette subfamily B protein|nr:ABC transporter ATP-binding protein/permease [Clostridiales Family XIII bacterium]
MRKLKKIMNLSEKGWADFKKAIISCVLSNLSLLLPFIVILQALMTLIDPIVSGNPLNTIKLWLVLGGGILAAAVYFIAYKNEYRKTYTTAYTESETIRLEVAEHIRRLPLSFFNKKDLSELTTNMMGDCTNIEHTMSHVAPGLVADIITATVTCALLAVYDWRMAIAMFAALPLSVLTILSSKGLQRKFGKRHVLAKMNVSGQVQEYLDGIKVVKAFGLSGEKSKALDGALRDMMYESIKYEGLTGIFISLGMMFLQVGIGLVVFVGVGLLTAGSLSAVPFLIFVLISAKIYAPLIVILTLLPELFYLFLSTARMQALRTEPILEGDKHTQLPDCNIELRNVTFSYGADDVIKDVSVKLPQDTVTALVGPSGSGKSTISRLIARFWDVNEGEILIGGKNIKTIDPEHLLHYMSFVFQDVVLFDDTIMNNIRIGKEGATDEEVFRVAQAARCDEFIRNLPDGYDTVIGENGSTLSGGERQRISIARALLKDAPIVLLDEATSSLDPENEILIQEAISALVKGRTVITIAHRLRTIMDADKIIVLEEGRLTEEGTGNELLEKDGLFARLYHIQQESQGWSVGRPTVAS